MIKVISDLFHVFHAGGLPLFLKDVSKISNQCPRCKKKKRMYVERITIY